MQTGTPRQPFEPKVLPMSPVQNVTHVSGTDPVSGINRNPCVRNGPTLAGWGARIRTWEWRNQNPLPYHLATPHRGYMYCEVAGGPYRRNRSGSTLPPPSRRLAGPGCRRYNPPRPHTRRSRSVAQPGSAPRSGRGGRRFKSCHSDHLSAVQPGHIGDRTYLRHG
jgi:hypothetical protein